MIYSFLKRYSSVDNVLFNTLIVKKDSKSFKRFKKIIFCFY